MPEQSNCNGCQAPLATIQAAIESIRRDLDSVIESINSIGQITEAHNNNLTQLVNAVGEVQRQFTGVNPLSMLRGLMGGRNG
jgi:Fe-S cluster biogenesis protein NfuA